MQADNLESLRQNVAAFSDDIVKIPPLGGGNQMAAQEALSNQEPAKATDDGRHEGDAMDAKREGQGVRLEPLKVEIVEDGKLLRTVLVDDPRQRICDTFNSLEIGQQRAIPA